MSGRSFFRVIATAVCVALVFSASGFAEVFSPIDVELVLPQFPALGETATVDCVVESAEYFDSVSVRVRLSDGLELVGGNLTWQGPMIAHQQVRLTFAVRAAVAGNQTIRADAIAGPAEGSSFGDTSQLFFYTAAGKAVEGHVYDYVRTETPAVNVDTGEVAYPTRLDDYRPSSMQQVIPEPSYAFPGQMPVQGGGPVPSGSLVVTGAWRYYDRADVSRPLQWVRVELLRGSDGVLLASTVTDENGQYTFPAVTNPGASGFRVRAWCYFLSALSSDGTALRVVDLGEGRTDGGNTVIGYNTSTSNRTSSDGTFDMGTWWIANGSANEPAWWLMQDLVAAFWWPALTFATSKMPGGVTVEWSPTSTHGDHNHRTDDGGNIHLKAESADVPDVLWHEYGHEVQWDGYGEWLPTSDCPSPHYINRVSGINCAWFEGFANWYKCAVSNDPVYHWPSGSSLNLETHTWGTPNWDNGDQCEGRVAGALWDIHDSAADGYDTSQLSPASIWDTWYGSTNRDSTFSQFWTRWKARGNPKHHPVKAIYQNTIDYNTAPTFGGLPDVSTPEDTAKYYAIDLWAYASDPESSDAELEYTIVSNTNPSCGASISSSGYVHIVPALNWYGFSDVTIRCSDGIRSRDDTFRVTVTAVNDPPVLSGIPDRVVLINSSNNNIIDLWNYTNDPDNSLSSLTYAIVGNTSPQCGVVIDAFDFIDINPNPGWTGYSDVTIRVTDPGGLWSEDTFRIVVVSGAYNRIQQARNNPDGTWIQLYGPVVTGKLTHQGYSYIEETDRTAGIRIALTGDIAPGQVLSVSGPLSTSYAERVITPYLYSVLGTTQVPSPLALRHRDLGGASPDSYTPSVPQNGSGAYNVGLLVRTTGRVISHAGGGRFYIDDGSQTVDNATGKPSVFVYATPSGWPPPVGSHVTITGISGASTLGGKPMRILRPRTDADVVLTAMRVAYIYKSGLTEAQGYKELLDAHGLLTDLIPVSALLSTDLSGYHVIVIAPDAYYLTSAQVNAILATNASVIARGTGGCMFLDQAPNLYIGWGHSWVATGQTHATVVGGDIYSYPYQIPYAPGSNIYVAYSPGVTAICLHDPDGATMRILRQYGDATHYAVAGEQSKFYQWAYEGSVAQLTAWGRRLFVNLVYRSVRP